MKLKPFLLAIDTIKEEVSCPKCKKKISDQQIELIGVIQNKIRLLSKCENCKALISTKATVGPAPDNVKKMKTVLSSSMIHDISQSLKTAKGDIKSLFTED